MKMNSRELKLRPKVRKALVKGKSIKRVALHYKLRTEFVNSLYQDILDEEIANSPRRIIAKKIRQLQDAADSALNEYNENPKPYKAYAVTNLISELRASISSLQELLDLDDLTEQYIGNVLKPVILRAIRVFVEEIGGARDELVSHLDESSGKEVNTVMKDSIRLLKGKVNELFLFGIEKTEKTFRLNLEEYRNEILVYNEASENTPTKKSKLKLLKSA